MFIKFVRDGNVSIFEGNAIHLKQPKVRIGHDVREISPSPKESEGFDDTRVITLEREGKDALKFLIRLEEVKEDKLWIFLMNNHGETIERIYR